MRTNSKQERNSRNTKAFMIFKILLGNRRLQELSRYYLKNCVFLAVACKSSIYGKILVDKRLNHKMNLYFEISNILGHYRFFFNYNNFSWFK